MRSNIMVPPLMSKYLQYYASLYRMKILLRIFTLPPHDIFMPRKDLLLDIYQLIGVISVKDDFTEFMSFI